MSGCNNRGNKWFYVCIVVLVVVILIADLVSLCLLVHEAGKLDSVYDYTIHNNCTIKNELDCHTVVTKICEGRCIFEASTYCYYTVILHKSEYFDGTEENSTRTSIPTSKIDISDLGPKDCYLNDIKPYDSHISMHFIDFAAEEAGSVIAILLIFTVPVIAVFSMLAMLLCVGAVVDCCP